MSGRERPTPRFAAVSFDLARGARVPGASPQDSRRVLRWSRLPRWTSALPIMAAMLAAVTWGSHPATPVLVLAGVLLGASVIAAVHHAEVVAHRVGEPFGSLVLAVAVTVIEVALIVTLITAGGEKVSTLARDTV